MSDKDIRLLALFFYFALLDNKRAFDLTNQSYQFCLKQKEKNPQIRNSVLIVATTIKYWKIAQKNKSKKWPYLTSDGGWTIPDKIDIGPWLEFQKTAPSEELLVIIWSKILNISFSDISIATEIPEGTLRYRMARATKNIGSMTNLFPKKLEQVSL